MTGRLSPALLALVQTLRYKQSSDRAGSRGGAAGAAGACAAAPGAAAPRPPPPRPGPGAPAAHGAPNASALRTPSHLATGCGAFHRFSPSGGAANGMPLNTRTVGWPLVVPAIIPESMRTCSGTIAFTYAVAMATAAASAVNAVRFIAVLSKRRTQTITSKTSLF